MSCVCAVVGTGRSLRSRDATLSTLVSVHSVSTLSLDARECLNLSARQLYPTLRMHVLSMALPQWAFSHSQFTESSLLSFHRFYCLLKHAIIRFRTVPSFHSCAASASHLTPLGPSRCLLAQRVHRHGHR